MEERRKKGMCFNCDETFVRGHQCKKLFWIDLEEENEPTEEMEQELSPKISLNAITRLNGCWNGGQVLILVDFGSTRSFISVFKVAELKAEVNGKDGLRVNLANGEQVSSPKICKGTLIELELNTFTVDLFVLPLTDFNIVLGVNWLRVLFYGTLNITCMFFSYTEDKWSSKEYISNMAEVA